MTPIHIRIDLRCERCTKRVIEITYSRPRRFEDLLPVGWLIEDGSVVCVECQRVGAATSAPSGRPFDGASRGMA